MFIRILSLLLACVFVLSPNELDAQKKVLGVPTKYLRPNSPYQGSETVSSFFDPVSAWRVKAKKTAWRIIVDRNGVSAREQPTSSAIKKTSLKFRDAYYVDEVEGNWLHLIDAIIDDLKINGTPRDIGWVRAQEVMLWHQSLINPRTKIPLKALLINRLDKKDQIPCDDKELVQIYQDPIKNILTKSSTIYNFFFVYKKENGRYLLGSDTELGIFSAEDALLGWVPEDRLAEWNTRIALEPNFEEPAFKERSAKVNFRVHGYTDQFDAVNHAKKGIPPSGALWLGDPVKGPAKELSKADPARFNADLMRYPLLSVGKGEDLLDYHRSAVCDYVLLKKGCDPNTGFLVVDKVDPIMAAQQREFIENHQQVAKNFNIFFVVEASSQMAKYKEAIASFASSIKKSIQGLQDKPNVRFGALAYRDLKYSSNPDELIAYQRPTPNLSDIQSFIRGTEFATGTTNEAFPVQNYGISQALNVAKFNPYHTNIMIVLGAKGDFTYNRVAALTANKVLMPDKSTITDAINKYQVNLFGIQCIGGQLLAEKEFAKNLVGILQDAASKNYILKGREDRYDPKIRQLLKEDGYTFQRPTLANPSEENTPLSIPLKNASLHGGVDRILENRAEREIEDLDKKLNTYVSAIVKENIALSNDIEKWKSGKLGAGRWNGKSAQLAGGYVKYTGPELDWTNEKYELYQDVYFAKQPQGAAYPTFSYVLFWTEQGLRAYLGELKRSLNAIGNQTSSEQREGLQQLYCSLIEEFTGNTGSKCEDYTIEEVERMIQGVENEGINFSGKENKEKLKDLLDKREVSIERIREIIDELTNVRDRLEKLVNNQSNEFIFERNKTRFYWIKSSDLYF